MSIYNNIQKNHKTVYYIIVFALVAAAVLYIYPRKVQFKYGFQQGKTWQHPDLVAPFQFTVQKTEAELQQEIDWLRQNRDLFFKEEEETLEKQITVVVEEWNSISVPDSIKRLDSTALFKAIRFVYGQGLIDGSYANLHEQQGLFLVNQNKVTQFLPGDYLTVSDAVQTINGALKHPELWQNDLPSFLIPNIVFDQERTDRIRNERIAAIGKNKGLIDEGELLIFKGDLVDEEKFLILESLRKAYATKQADKVLPFQLAIGQLIYIVILLTTLYSFLHFFRPQLLNYIANINLVLFTILWMVFAAIIVVRINPDWLYIVPFPIVPVIMRAFYDTRLALFVHLITILLVGYYAPNSFEFVFIEFIAGVSAIINVTGLYKRSQLFVAAIKIIGVYIIAYLAFILLQESEIERFQLYAFAYLIASGFFSLLAFPLIFLYEKTFAQVSDLTLLELADTNSSVLRELAQKAPGTFQHSMQVANLAEQAALTIGANTLLVRTGALYHDIGKMLNPLYFVENQVTGVNPHDDLAFEESAEIIVRHVLDGVKLAKKQRLPELIIDFIRTHHGTTRVEYFYRQYVKSFPANEDAVDRFTYPGPKPFSRETAILMMADSVEAASRSLKQKNNESLANLVDGIIDYQLNLGQFDNANITLRDIATIKQVFKQLLANIYHARIEYPEKVA
jgi:putative nucleotidyltransferase with HDIG domain